MPTGRVGNASEWLRQAVKEHLEGKRQELLEVIENYPPPIPACDQQFNHLIEQRDAVAGELSRLEALCEETSVPKDAVAALEAFVAASRFIDGEAGRRIRAGLQKPVEAPPGAAQPS
jgi:hypothetical protein